MSKRLNAKLADKFLRDETNHEQKRRRKLLKDAAADMLTALLAIDQGFRDGSIKFTKRRQSDSDPYHPANTLMCAAIAKATGEDGAQ